MDSAIEGLLKEIERALEARLYYLAIIICLTLPDVCAALESADGRTSEKRYKAWHSAHIGSNADEYYSLRCGMTHQGKMQIKKGRAERIIFTTKHTPYRVHGFILTHQQGKAYMFDAEMWCQKWITGVRKWFETAKDNPHVRQNLDDMLQLRPAGLKPWVNGLLVIA